MEQTGTNPDKNGSNLVINTQIHKSTNCSHHGLSTIVHHRIAFTDQTLLARLFCIKFLLVVLFSFCSRAYINLVLRYILSTC